MKSSVFCDTTTCSPLEVNRRFGVTCRLQIQGQRIRQERNQHESGTKQSCSACFTNSSTPKMQATCSSETSVDFQRTTRRYIPENWTLELSTLFVIICIPSLITYILTGSAYYKTKSLHCFRSPPEYASNCYWILLELFLSSYPLQFLLYCSRDWVLVESVALSLTSSFLLRSENCKAPFFSRITFLLIPSAVGIATGYGLYDRGVEVRVLVGARILSSPRCPDRPWVPPSLLSSGYQGLFPWG
jgi:hypothetical protein